ncbi:MAG: hypothetical protein CME26_02225 [Gemmatimonadetes bacterium]|nr:hypothetical protein [Gemmatimonadota bacterium]
MTAIVLLFSGPAVGLSATDSISTIAGNGIDFNATDPLGGGGFYISDGGPATQVLMTPGNPHIGLDGTIHVLNGSCVPRIDANSNVATVALAIFEEHGGDGGPATEGGFRATGLTVGANRAIYLAAGPHDNIRRISVGGYDLYIRRGCAPGPFQAPSGGFAGDGGPASAALFNNPTGITTGPDGALYVTVTFNHRIRKISTAGTGMAGFSGDGGPAAEAELNSPNRISAGSDGAVYFVGRSNDRVRRVGPNGAMTTIAGTGSSSFSGDGGPATEARIDPSGVAVDSDGVVYIATDNHRGGRVGTDGIITTIVGDGTAGFEGDGGLAINARIDSPRDLAFGPDGTLYIADGGNWRIRRVTLGPQRSLSLSIGNDPAFWGDLAEVTIDVGGSVCITSAEFSISYDETVLDPRSLILQPLVTDSSLNLEWVVESDVMNFSALWRHGNGRDRRDPRLNRLSAQGGRGTSPRAIESTSFAGTADSPVTVSSPAPGLIVIGSADFNSAGRVDFTDFLAFVGVFWLRAEDEGYDVKFDLYGNSEISFADVLAFVKLFQA